MTDITGLHHITAIASDAQTNIDFYTRVLGLRLIKVTVNFDDPTAYHLYYGDRVGTPGSLLTFFIWPHTPKGRGGIGQTVDISFKIPIGSLTYWKKRLDELNILSAEPTYSPGPQFVTLNDPDGLEIHLVEDGIPPSYQVWDKTPIPADHAITSLHGCRLLVSDLDPTADFLIKLGFERGIKSDNIARFNLGEHHLFVQFGPDLMPGINATGTVHHIAWRTADENSQKAARQILLDAGTHPTEVIDRLYFKSIYFHEPGRALFEVATQGPGFQVDEKEDHLGTSLQLPFQYNMAKAEIIKVLKPILVADGKRIP